MSAAQPDFAKMLSLALLYVAQKPIAACHRNQLKLRHQGNAVFSASAGPAISQPSSSVHPVFFAWISSMGPLRNADATLRLDSSAKPHCEMRRWRLTDPCVDPLRCESLSAMKSASNPSNGTAASPCGGPNGPLRLLTGTRQTRQSRPRLALGLNWRRHHKAFLSRISRAASFIFSNLLR